MVAGTFFGRRWPSRLPSGFAAVHNRAAGSGVPPSFQRLQRVATAGSSSIFARIHAVATHARAMLRTKANSTATPSSTV